MISLCVPTRGRPERFRQMVESARSTADGEFEVVARVDDDDVDYPPLPGVRYERGPRRVDEYDRVQMSGLWTEAWEHARGDVAMLCADDVVFETGGWNESVEQEFARFPDRILMVYTNTGRDMRPVLPFVSREWIDAAGFTPPDLQGWFADEWIWAMAAEIGRVSFLPDVTIRHEQLGDDMVYLEAQQARASMGGLQNMRQQFYSIPMVKRRDALVPKLRSAMTSTTRTAPSPTPQWYHDSLRWDQQAREHDRMIREETLVVVHCYKGDRAVAKNAMPLFLHHGAPVLVLSPEDSPVTFRAKGVTCRSAGKAAYYGQDSLDRQREHLKILLEYPQRFFLLNDADSLCLDPVIPSYLYERSPDGVVFSNEVGDWRQHESPYPKIAMQPPYFLTRETIERLLAVGPILAHPITPYIDWYMVAATYSAGLAHATFPDGASFPAWRRTDIPETQLMGHNFQHKNDPEGFIHGDVHMRQCVLGGAVLIHSVKHKEVLRDLVEAHADYVRRGSPPLVSGGPRITLSELAESIRRDHESVRAEGGQAGMGFGESVRV
jgi:hypothetical protein